MGIQLLQICSFRPSEILMWDFHGNKKYFHSFFFFFAFLLHFHFHFILFLLRVKLLNDMESQLRTHKILDEQTILLEQKEQKEELFHDHSSLFDSVDYENE